MGIIPEPGEVSICEINRELLVSKGAGDTAAQDRYATILGRSFPPLNVLLHPSPASTLGNFPVITISGDFTHVPPQVDVVEPSSVWQQALASTLRRWIGPQKAEADHLPAHSGAVSWHPNKERVAVVGEHDRVVLFSYDKPGGVPAVLLHEFQRDVSSLSWRPNAASVLAVGCREGVCLWTIDPRAAEQRGRAATVAKATMTFLQTSRQGPVSSSCWSPCGSTLLAFATSRDSTVTLYEVASGALTYVRRGFGGIQLLSWSPSGDFFVSANLDGSFHVWETATWTSEPWVSADGALTSAAWSPDSRVLVGGFENSTTLTALYLATPPSLNAHLLPLDLSHHLPPNARSVGCMAWDAAGERLAVSYQGGEGHSAGLVALFSTRLLPLVALTLIGFLQGPGEGCQASALSFQGKRKKGALLAVVREFYEYYFFCRWCGTVQKLVQTV